MISLVEKHGPLHVKKHLATLMRPLCRTKGLVETRTGLIRMLRQWLNYCENFEVLPAPICDKSAIWPYEPIPETFGGLPLVSLAEFERCFGLSITLLSKNESLIDRVSGTRDDRGGSGEEEEEDEDRAEMSSAAGEEEESSCTAEPRRNKIKVALVVRRGTISKSHEQHLGASVVLREDIQSLCCEDDEDCGDVDWNDLSAPSARDRYLSLYLDMSEGPARKSMPNEEAKNADDLMMHVTFIRDTDKYCTRAMCDTCGDVFTRLDHLAKHSASCTGAQRVSYDERAFESDVTILEKIRAYGCPPLPPLDPYVVVWDCEAYFPRKTGSTRGVSAGLPDTHEVLSFSLSTDIPACRPLLEHFGSVTETAVCSDLDTVSHWDLDRGHFEDGATRRPVLTVCLTRDAGSEAEPDKGVGLTDKLLRMHVLLSKHQYRLNKRKYAMTLAWLKTSGRRESKLLDEYASERLHTFKPKSVYFALRAELKNYLRQLTSLTYNGSSYDLNLLKTHLFRCLNLRTKPKPPSGRNRSSRKTARLLPGWLRDKIAEEERLAADTESIEEEEELLPSAEVDVLTDSPGPASPAPPRPRPRQGPPGYFRRIPGACLRHAPPFLPTLEEEEEEVE